MSSDQLLSQQWFFACPQLMEPLLADELVALGAEHTKIGHAGVQASGDLGFGYRVMLWSRLASRAMLQLAQGYSKDQAELKALLSTIPWHKHIRPDGSLKVRFFGRNEDIRNTQFGAQWVKDQISDYFMQRAGQRPDVSDSPDVLIVVNLHKDRASVGLELNQQGLHQHGYPDPDTYQPMRENLAAAVLIRAGWPALLQHSAECWQLLDTHCRSSVLLIEGALMALDIAPGLLRGRTVAQRWLGHDAELWSRLRKEAQQRQQAGLAQAARYQFYATGDKPCLQNLQTDWAVAGLPETCLSVARMPPSPSAQSNLQKGLALSWLESAEDATHLQLQAGFQAAGEQLAALPEGFQAAILTPAKAPIALTQLFYNKEYRLLNGEAPYKIYTINKLKQQDRSTHLFAEDLANRIKKNLRRLKPFIKRGESNAYRVYDADIPEYAIAVDRYADWLHVQEYAPPKSIDEKTAAKRLEQALMTLPETLNIAPERIVLKQRKRQKGKNQYEKQDRAEQALIVTEQGVRLKVNLTDYLDTGLFLDHRPMRYWIQQRAKEKSVLNLFCYTGAVSVHAAVGGAAQVDSVDMSATYLEWAKANFQLNGLKREPYKYRFIQANAVEWLRQGSPRHYDLIFLDPPTFSNSKRMEEVFDVQRDHADLVQQAMGMLNPEGTLVFSNNYRRFKLDAAIEAAFAVQNYHRESLPVDFERNPRIHGCWLIRHRE